MTAIKNDKQIYYNQVKGFIDRIDDGGGGDYCSVTLILGHENKRYANICIKKFTFEQIKDSLVLGDYVQIKYFLVSREKNNKWYTSANFIEIEKIS